MGRSWKPMAWSRRVASAEWIGKVGTTRRGFASSRMAIMRPLGGRSRELRSPSLPIPPNVITGDYGRVAGDTHPRAVDRWHRHWYGGGSCVRLRRRYAHRRNLQEQRALVFLGMRAIRGGCCHGTQGSAPEGCPALVGRRARSGPGTKPSAPPCGTACSARHEKCVATTARRHATGARGSSLLLEAIEPS